MAIHKGSEGLVKVGSNTVAEVKSYSIDETADTIESTSMGDSAKTFESSLTSFSGSVECHFDDDRYNRPSGYEYWFNHNS